jgi:hypothetical protein
MPKAAKQFKHFSEDPIYQKAMRKFIRNPINIDVCLDIVDLRLQNAYLQILVEELQQANTQKDIIIAEWKHQ